ncbi:MAG: RidA family protein [Phycisphaerae bacterium]|nr:RidA family protein [Phycisphaerae bacterium]
MAKKQPHTPEAWKNYKGPYSVALTVGDLIIVSGQGPIDPDGMKVIGEGIQEQAKITLDNVKNALAAAGATMDDCVKVGVFLSDIKNFNAFNEVYRTYFSEPLPCRTCVETALFGGMLVEVDAWAVRGAGG